ncbi:putative transcriptional regulator TetR family [Patulibacter medicamentivorans]|uniref:Putative transcriptional regulator TetR family n=2 Tax=Patulibacter medicamentivorans TaxID=1097667 RepID=H0DZQ7_9ACTN|nr:putative transcriptional regulator TetR family [Patulibacter medicamentivorans]
MVVAMARPRLHDLDALLDAAEELLAEGGEPALTIRAIAERAGAPSGSLYHAFGSRAEVLGRMWLRAARRFLVVQRAAIDEHLSGDAPGWEAAVEATVAAAAALDLLRRDAPASARVLIEHRREALIADGLSEPLTAELLDLDRELLDVLRRLAAALWGRGDREAIETVAVCVVDLPSSLLDGRRERRIDPLRALRAAVVGVLGELPGPTTRG